MDRLKTSHIHIMRIHDAEDEERFTQATEYTDSKNKNIIELLKEMKL